jgi:protein gp37
MPAETKIEWTDFSSNPLKFRDAGGRVVWGCVKTSPGCARCYAEATAERWQRGGPFNARTMEGLTPFVDDKELRAILTSTKIAGKRVFIGDMTDVFGEWVPFELLDRMFAAFALRPDVTFQILTKRAERMEEYFADRTARWKAWDTEAIRLAHNELCAPYPLDNLWLGVSVEDQTRADERIPMLLQTPAAVRFLSCEPLLGELDLGLSNATCDCCPRWPSRWVRLTRPIGSELSFLGISPADCVADTGVYLAKSNKHGALSVHTPGGLLGIKPREFEAMPSLDWIIVGGESGPGARPLDVEWIRSIVKQCQAAGVACFVKQLGAVIHATDGIDPLDQFPGSPRSLRQGPTIDTAEIRLKSAKGGDPAEWPEDVRVREFPRRTSDR